MSCVMWWPWFASTNSLHSGIQHAIVVIEFVFESLALHSHLLAVDIFVRIYFAVSHQIEQPSYSEPLLACHCDVGH